MKDYFFRKVNPAKDFWIIVEMAHPEIFSFPPFRWIPALIYRISLCFLCLYHQRNSIISYLIVISLFLSCDSITLFPLDDGHATFSTSNLRSPCAHSFHSSTFPLRKKMFFSFLRFLSFHIFHSGCPNT